MINRKEVDYMKKIFSDYGIYFCAGSLITVWAIPSDVFWVNIIIIPIGYLLQFIGLLLAVKNFLEYLRNKKRTKQEYELKPKNANFME